MCLQIENASTEIGATVSVGSDSGTQNCRWGLEAVLTPRSGVLFYDTENDIVCYDPTKYVAPEDVISLDDLGIEPTYYSHDEINQDFVWSSSGTSIATVNSSGSITGVSYGTVTITATHVLSSSSASYTLQVTGIPNGTYFIRNKQTGYYADIQGPTMADGTTIHQWKFNGNNSQKWIFEHQGDGFYTVKSANSTTDYYLGVLNDDSTVNTDIVLRNGEVTFGMLWNVSVTSSGAFKLTAKKGYALDYALATTTTSQTNGAKLVHGQYMPNNNSYCDEWEFRPYRYYDYKLLALNENGIDRNSYFTPVSNILNSNFHGNIMTDFYISYSVDQMKTILSDSEIFIIHTHGKKDGFMIDWNTKAYLTMSDINNYSLNRLHFALLLTCKTGKDFSESNIANNTPTNIVEKMVCQGADCVVGFEETTWVSDCNKFAKEFMEKISEGHNVYSAIYSIDYDDKENENDNYIKNMFDISAIGGNKYMTLN